jgi:hypothetical protein
LCRRHAAEPLITFSPMPRSIFAFAAMPFSMPFSLPFSLPLIFAIFAAFADHADAAISLLPPFQIFFFRFRHFFPAISLMLRRWPYAIAAAIAALRQRHFADTLLRFSPMLSMPFGIRHYCRRHFASFFFDFH